MENVKFVEGLRRMADWYEKHPDFAQPNSYSNGLFSDFVFSKKEVEKAREAFGKGVMVEADDWHILVYKSFGDMQMRVFASRGAVCTKRIVGTKKVIRKVATQWTEREEEEDIIEWDCPPEFEQTKKEGE